MKITMIISTLAFLLLLISSGKPSALADNNNEHDDFLKCLSEKSHNTTTSLSNLMHTPSDSSYTPLLRFSIQNMRFVSNSTTKPRVIITPKIESQIPPIIHCAKDNDIQIRTRSGGHDYEGLSYVSKVPFVILDLINFNEITVDPTRKTAWVQSGSTLGSLYYRIAEASPVLGFPAGVCPTVGIGGHFSGSGYGALLRKYGLAADVIIDARIIDVHGRILDRESMGEDLFWAIRGGGGASFGVILAWKIRLVDVPERVTVFNAYRTLDQNATRLVHRWQKVGHRFDRNLFLRVIITRAANPNPNGGNFTTIRVLFNSIFLGGVDRLIPMLREEFPELGLVREDCREMSWIDSVLFFADFNSTRVLLDRTQPNVPYFKAKSDYVQRPIPVHGLEGIWRMFYEAEADEAVVIMTPYGGVMDEIPESSIPFPHRAGNLYKIQYLVSWQGNEDGDSERYVSWIRRLYRYMAPYVSRNPRSAYINYRDLDIGVNEDDHDEGKTSYSKAKVWGVKYFKSNFERLVRVKTAVDPDNFFRNEQSIPSLGHSQKDD